MSRQQRRGARGGETSLFTSCKRENLAEAAMVADQGGVPGVAELMRQVMKGGLAVSILNDRNKSVAEADLPSPEKPVVLVLGDDDHASTGPLGWRCAKVVAEWCRCAMIHAAGGSAETYAPAANAARMVGSVLLIETDTTHVDEWAALLFDKQTLLVLPRVKSLAILTP